MSRFVFPAAMLALFSLYSGTATAYKPETPGDVVMVLIPAAGYFIAHAKDDDEGEGQWVRTIAGGVVAHAITAVAFNYTSWGERPNGGQHAFPSGHTALAFSGASFLQDRYGWHYGVPAYLAASYVGYVRVDTTHHRWRDIIGGAVLAIGVSKLFVTPQGATHIAPVIGPDWLGLRWERSF